MGLDEITDEELQSLLAFEAAVNNSLFEVKSTQSLGILVNITEEHLRDNQTDKICTLEAIRVSDSK